MNAHANPISIASATRIDAICDRFEAAWRTGQPVRIEDLLATVAESDRAAALAALLRVELELRQRAGDQPQASDYESRFVHQAATVVAVFAELNRQPTTDTSVAQAQTRTLSVGHDPTTAQPLDEPQPEKIGRFVIVSKLGEGAFGTVYRARDPELDREVAIKVPRMGTLTNQSDIERFLREAKAAATMHHPNICPVYEVGTANGRPFIVMALVPGKSLADHIKQRPVPFPERQSALIIRKLALALELAHQKGIVHRDLKPANILIDDERKDVVVMDFGLARREAHDAAQITHSGMLMGTPAYMSPEQARGDTATIGPASDVYSLGVVLYELLAGERPFTGSLAEVLGKILHVDPPPPSARRQGIDPRLEAIAMRAMARRTEDRYPSMRALADALSGWLKVGDSLRESPAGAPPAEIATKAVQPAEATPSARPLRVRLWRVLTAAVVLAGLVAAATIFFLQTPHGTVRIEINDPAIKVILDRGIATFQGADKDHVIELKPGEHGLTITRGDFTFYTTKFELKKRGATTLKVEFLAGTIQVSQDGKLLSSKSLPTVAASRNFALEFDGVDDYVSLPHIEYDRKSPVTFEAWITPALGQDQSQEKAQFMVWANQGSFLVIAPWGWQFYHFGQGAIAEPVRAGQRVHVVAQWDGHKCRVFVNGAAAAAEADNESAGELDDAARNDFLPRVLGAFGNWRGEALRHFFPGQLHEVRISSVARYDQNFTPPAADRPFAADEHTLALYHFNEGEGAVLKDSSGNNYHGKIVGAKWVSSSAKPSSARTTGPRPAQSEKNFTLLFDGIDDYVEIADWKYDGSHPLTVEAWVTPEKLPTGVEIISTSEQSGFNLAIWKDDRWAFSVVAGTPAIWATAPFKPEHSNRRLHVAGVYDRQQVRLYVEGVEMQRVAAPDAYKPSTQPLILGGNPNLGKIVFHYAGQIDEVRISRVGRYAGNFQPRERLEADADTLALYHFDEGTGEILKDSSGHNRHGKIVGAQWINLASGQTTSLATPLDPHRAAAEWVFGMHGKIRIVSEGVTTRQVRSVAQLPDKPFQLAGLYIEYPAVAFDAEGITRLNGLQSLESFGIEHDGFTDEAFCQLEGLSEVFDLDIHSTQVTDVSLAHVATMPKVRRLNFGRTAATGKRLDELQALDLELLILHDAPIGDEALAHLPLFPNLFHLGLANTKVTDPGLAPLAKLSKLTFLDLGGTAISGAGLAPLKVLPALERLRLVDAAGVGDTAIEHLAAFKQLKLLELNGTGVSAMGLDRLRAALPNCQIVPE